MERETGETGGAGEKGEEIENKFYADNEKKEGDG